MKGRGSEQLAAAIAATLVFVAVMRYGAAPPDVLAFVVKAIGATMAGVLALLAVYVLRELGTSGHEVAHGRGLTALSLKKERLLGAIKELDFDRAIGKLDDKDHQFLRARYEQKARAVLRELDETEGPARRAAEALLARRLGRAPAEVSGVSPGVGGTNGAGRVISARVVPGAGARAAGSSCVGCGRGLSADARFCDGCGTAVSACGACGAHLDAGARFCAGCGAAVHA